MKLFSATIKTDFGMEYFAGHEIKLTPTEEYDNYYWVIHPVTGKPTTDAVHTSLLREVKELPKAA